MVSQCKQACTAAILDSQLGVDTDSDRENLSQSRNGPRVPEADFWLVRLALYTTSIGVTRHVPGVDSSGELHQTLKVWNLTTGECLATFTCDEIVSCCACSEALGLIVAGGTGGQVHFLRLEEAKAKS